MLPESCSIVCGPSIEAPVNLPQRDEIFRGESLPDVQELIAAGRSLASSVGVGTCPFLTEHRVASESEYKRRCIDEGRLMLHGQIGFRSAEKSRRAYREIHDRLADAGYRVDRFGLCLDWSMGYPRELRAGKPRGTGLILDDEASFAALTGAAPVAPHFGDFVLGTPAALENTRAALLAGSTSIGNIGQYFTFRMPHWDDDVGTTAETVKAIVLCAAQPVEVLIHSNLDDGFAALFSDLACSLGAVLIEKHIVDGLLGARVSHCYGHTFSDPVSRLAFQRGLARVSETPGSMVYGNTTIYGASETENWANLASYLMVDIIAQRTTPTGHALNPVPVSEARRIPDIDEVVDAHLFANRLIARAEAQESLFDFDEVDDMAAVLVEGARRFERDVLSGLDEVGVDTGNALEMLIAIRRIGAKRLEELFGPGKLDATQVRGRRPLVEATTVADIAGNAREIVRGLGEEQREVLKSSGLSGCVACTDVHEYGKLLIESVLQELGVAVVDAGVSSDPEAVASVARKSGASFIAISTYNGVALDYVRALKQAGPDVAVFIGGRLNQIEEGSTSHLPVDVTGELEEAGAIACVGVDVFLSHLFEMAREACHD